MAYMIRNEIGLYWNSHLGGWLEERSHATWYGSRYEAEQDSAKCGGQVLVINDTVPSDPYYVSDFLFHL